MSDIVLLFQKQSIHLYKHDESDDIMQDLIIVLHNPRNNFGIKVIVFFLSI